LKKLDWYIKHFIFYICIYIYKILYVVYVYIYKIIVYVKQIFIHYFNNNFVQNIDFMILVLQDRSCSNGCFLNLSHTHFVFVAYCLYFVSQVIYYIKYINFIKKKQIFLSKRPITSINTLTFIIMQKRFFNLFQ